MAEAAIGRTNRTRNPRFKRRASKREAFLKALERLPAVTYACKSAKISKDTAYRWRKEAPAFAEKWDALVAQGLPALEDEALRRAYTSSDTLIIFLLKSLNRAKYGEKVDINVLIRSDPKIRSLMTGIGQILEEFVAKEKLPSAIARLRLLSSVLERDSGLLGTEQPAITDARVAAPSA